MTIINSLMVSSRQQNATYSKFILTSQQGWSALQK